MSRFALISVGFHALVVTAMTVSWPAFQKKTLMKNSLSLLIWLMWPISQILQQRHKGRSR